MMDSAGPPHRVCIVDDEPDVRELLSLLCESAGLASTTYESAEAFLASLCSGKSGCELIVLDIDMPGMSGQVLLKTLKERGFPQPVVMISGRGDAATISAAKKLGAAAFFGKPFNVRVVRHRICELLGEVPQRASRTPDALGGPQAG